MPGQDGPGDQRSRRWFLKALGALSVVGLAGCGGDDGDDTPTETPPETTEPDMGDTDTPVETTEPDMGDTDTPPETTAPPTTTEPSGNTLPDPLPELLSFSETPSVEAGGTTTISGTITNPFLFDLVEGEYTIEPPSDDWEISPASGTTIDSLESQSSQTAEWEVSAPESASGEVALAITASYASSTDQGETTFEQPIIVVTPPEVSAESVSLEDLGPTWKHAMVPETGGGASDQVAFALPEDGFGVLDASLNPVDSWEGPDDKSAEVYLGYDADNFYMRIVVTDDTHNSVSGAGMWQGDCIQWATAADGRSTYGPDYGMRHGEDGSEVVQYPAGNAQEGASAIDLGTSREGTTTTYEATVPWTAMYAEAPSPGDSLPFDMVIHENDGESADNWEGALSWSEYSIYTPKQPKKEGTITLDTDGDLLPWEARLTGTPSAGQGERGTWTVTVANYADTDQDISVTFEDSDVEETITVSANGGARVNIETTILGEESPGVTLSNGNQSVSL